MVRIVFLQAVHSYQNILHQFFIDTSQPGYSSSKYQKSKAAINIIRNIIYNKYEYHTDKLYANNKVQSRLEYQPAVWNN